MTRRPKRAAETDRQRDNLLRMREPLQSRQISSAAPPLPHSPTVFSPVSENTWLGLDLVV